MAKYLDSKGVTLLWKKVKAEDAKRISATEKGAKNGVATLDASGFIPLAQLGNLDTTVAEVVKSLPTSGIKKHIYMIPSDETSDKNIYKEYVYTGDVSAAYDETKWEQLGEYKGSIDLSGYAKKTDAVSAIGTPTTTATNVSIPYTKADGTQGTAVLLPTATTTAAGLMSVADKTKLNGLSNYTLPKATTTVLGGIMLGYSATGKNYPVAVDANGKAYVNVPWENTTYQVASSSVDGLMSKEDKSKLDAVAESATADSAMSDEDIEAAIADA